MAQSAPAQDVKVVERLERLPLTAWQVKARVIVGIATFFDAFDALTIAYVLPVLIPLFKMSAQDVGFLISSSYVGQIFGALLFGWIAERLWTYARDDRFNRAVRHHEHRLRAWRGTTTRFSGSASSRASALAARCPSPPPSSSR